MNPWTIPNGLTSIRFAVGFWCVAVVAINYIDGSALDIRGLQWWTFWFVLFAFATDWLDGHIARTWPSQQSKLGEYIDPPADKLVVAGYMLFLMALGNADSWFEYVCFSAIALREVGMLLWRWIGGADLLPVSRWGKWKTAFQMGALVVYGLVPLFAEVARMGMVLLFTATVLTLWSLASYFLAGPRQASVS